MWGFYFMQRVNKSGCWGEIGGNDLKKILHRAEKYLTFHVSTSGVSLLLDLDSGAIFLTDGNGIIRDDLYAK
jgi:hypothetical protein